MKILAIETSCDETSVAILDFKEDLNFEVLSHKLQSQMDKHAEYGGVYPSLAKREHQLLLPILTKEALQESNLLTDKLIEESKLEGLKEMLEREEILFEGIKKDLNKEIKDIDAIAVTNGPGLAPALWVGVNFAKALSTMWNIPIIPVNHMEGHIVVSYMKENKIVKPEYPVLSLLVSGGHTELILSKKEGEYIKIGRTLDDAAGEAFDKTARLIGLRYPGGPKISARAKIARENNYKEDIKLPRPMLKEDSFNFSYSGLKTSVRNFLEKETDPSQERLDYLAKEFEDAVVETLITKTKKAIEEYSPKTLVIGGGVSANEHLRKSFQELIKLYEEITLLLPDVKMSTDNSIMIAIAGYLNKDKQVTAENLKAQPNLSL